MTRRLKIGYGSFIVIIFLVLDRVCKLYFKKFSPEGEFFILKKWIGLKLSYNPGIAFGIGLPHWLIIFLYALILAVILWAAIVAYKKNHLAVLMGCVLIWAGAWSNLCDRIFYGAVIDYIDVTYYSILNIADCMIFVGAVIIIIEAWKKEKSNSH